MQTPLTNVPDTASTDSDISLPEKVVSFRQWYRQENIGQHYSGWLHFGFTLTLSFAGIWLCLSQLDSPSWLEWLTLPISFVYANFAEYLAHRYVMHKPKKPVRIIYERHAKQHHHFFTEQAMAFESSRDFKAVLFPPSLIVFFIVVFALPVGLLLSWVFTKNVGLLFALTGLLYFVNYEIFHFIYHLHDQHWVYKIPGMKKLRQLHLDHHRQQLMSHKNFNITYPIADWVCGTLDVRRAEK